MSRLDYLGNRLCSKKEARDDRLCSKHTTFHLLKSAAKNAPFICNADPDPDPSEPRQNTHTSEQRPQ